MTLREANNELLPVVSAQNFRDSRILEILEILVFIVSFKKFK